MKTKRRKRQALSDKKHFLIRDEDGSWSIEDKNGRSSHFHLLPSSRAKAEISLRSALREIGLKVVKN